VIHRLDKGSVSPDYGAPNDDDDKFLLFRNLVLNQNGFWFGVRYKQKKTSSKGEKNMPKVYIDEDVAP
jgi:hypothetical protein